MTLTIEKCERNGYEKIKENKSSVTFRVTKKFNWGMFILVTLVCNVFGLVGYLFYYSVKKDWEDVYFRKV